MTTIAASDGPLRVHLAVALLDALGIERAGVIGHDWGGFTACLLALRHPDRVTGIVRVQRPAPVGRAQPARGAGAVAALVRPADRVADRPPARAVFVRGEHSGRRLTVPARAVFGAADFYVTSLNTLGGESHADDSSLRLLEGCGHWTPQERPDAVADAAKELFSRPEDR